MTPSTSPSDPAGRGGPILAVIDTPPAPPGWEDARAQLVRIVDPLGRAVAWLAPAHGGGCVGFAVRPSGERGAAWLHLFQAAEPAAARGGTGCVVRCALVTEEPREEQGLTDGWRFVERDPTAATLAATLAEDVPADRRERAGGLHLRFSAALTGGTLTLDLLAENRAPADLRLRLGLELGLLSVPLSDAAGTLHVELPGSPLRQDSGTRANIPPGAVAKLGGADALLGIEVEFLAGVSRLHYLARGGREIVSLLASAGKEPGDILTVEAGAAFQMAVALRVALAAQGNPGPAR